MVNIKYSKEQIQERFSCLNKKQINNIYNIYLELYNTDRQYDNNSPKFRCGYDSVCFISYLAGYFKGENSGKNLYTVWKKEKLTKHVPYGVKVAQLFVNNINKNKIVKIGG